METLPFSPPDIACLNILIMKHYPHDISDFIIHPLYKTKQFEYILVILFVILYPEATLSEDQKYKTAISTILNRNLDAYKAYRQCCGSLLLSRTLSSETAFLLTSLDLRNTHFPEYAGSIALAEALFNMLEEDCEENFDYWYAWFEERNAAFEQLTFMQCLVLMRNID
jgi:hypothetical protein